MTSDQIFCTEKRSFSENPEQYELENLSQRIQYTGYRHHKKDPKEFDIDLSVGRKADKSLCDPLDISCREEAVAILQKGMRKGLISNEFRGDFPAIVWSVVNDNSPVEARISNQANGTYHGYPLRENDPFREKVLKRWE